MKSFKIKKLLFLLTIVFSQGIVFSQVCNIDVQTTSQTQVCPGTVVDLTATATVYGSNQSFDFNIGSLPTGWSVSGGAAFSTPCGAGPDGAYFWASTAGSGTPSIETAGFDICTGGTIEFDMRYAVQGQGSPCEGPDEQDEGVSLQYSTDGGNTWVDIAYYSPDGQILPSNPGGNNSIASGNTPWTTWSTITVPIPSAAISGNTMFRWIQTNSSGSPNDNWGIDNVYINASACFGNANINWSTGENGTSSINPTITQDTVITADVYDDFGNYICTSQPFVFTVFNPSIDGGPDQTVCEGTSTTLTATGGTGLTWDNGVVDGVPFTPPIGTTVYTVTGTDVNGCLASDQVEITTIPGNSVNVDAGADQSICLGDNVVLTATGATTYDWDNGLGAGDTHTVSPTTTTTYIVTGTLGMCEDVDDITITVENTGTPTFNPIADVCVGDVAPVLPTNSTNGISGTWSGTVSTAVAGTFNFTFTPTLTCSNTTQISVTVNPIPSIDAGIDQTICEGETVTLTAAGTAGFVWDNGVTDGVAFTPPLDTTVYHVSVTQMGCSNSDSVTVIASPIPVVDAGVNQTVCDGEMVTLSASGYSGYVWNNNVVDGVAFAPPLGTTTYTVTVTGPTGCSSSDSLTVEVSPVPVVEAGIDQTVCDGEMITLAASGASGYVWDNGVTDGVAFNQAIGSEIYTVTVTGPTGCTHSDSVTVTVTPLPVVDPGLDREICLGGSTVLTANGATNYIWDNGGTNGQTVSPTITTTYTVIGSTGNCIDTSDVTITVNPLPEVLFTPDVNIGCEPLDVTFTVQSPSGVSCIWDFGDGNTAATCGTASNTYNGIGCYDVRMTTTDANGCVNSRNYVDMICLLGYPTAEFGLSPDVVTTTNSTSTMINNSSQDAVIYIWDFGDDTPNSSAFEPEHTFPYEEGDSYTITLIVDNGYGCTDTAYQTIKVEEDVVFYVPNTFTPDGDSFNQTFQPIFTTGYDPYDYKLLIYNRWGEIIFESHDTTVGWDGKYGGIQVQDGTYIWKIEFKQSMNDKRRTETGHVTIIR